MSTTSDISAGSGACGNSSTTPPSPLSLREATCIANNYGAGQAVTINVPTGTYPLTGGELRLGTVTGSNITLTGAGPANTVIDGNHANRVLEIDPSIVGGVQTSISGVTITNGRDDTFGGAGIAAGSGDRTDLDSLTVTDSVISNNQANFTAPSTSNNPGGGILFQGGRLTLTNATVSGNQSFSSAGSGVFYQAVGSTTGQTLTVTGSNFTGNSTANSGRSGTSGGALAVSGGSSTVTNSRFTGNAASSTGDETAVGGAIFQQTGNLTVTGSTFTGNSVTSPGTSGGGAILYTAGQAVLQHNRLVGNVGPGGVMTNSRTGTVDATANWWGCNSGPNTAGCETTTGTGITTEPRLVLTATADPTHVIGPNGTATLTASLLTDSADGAVGSAELAPAFDGVPVTFADPPGDATVTGDPGAHSVNLAGGEASIDYHSNTTTGPNNTQITLDNATVTAALEVDQPPAITSADTASFIPGTPAGFTITTTGYPAARITEVGGLPSGLAFQNNGDGSATISGTPAAGTGGSYPIDLTAANGVSPSATQTLTIKVGRPPAITSPATATFRIGSAGTFTVTTSGDPTVSRITASGSLPPGVTFSDNRDGTATIAGTPTGTGNTYPVTLTAANGVSPDATQNLTIQVDEAPVITLNPSDQTVAPDTSVSFSAAASGVPTPTVQWQRSTDGGHNFADIAGATSTTYAFRTTAADDGNQYRAVFSNGVGSAAVTTAAGLHVGSAPSFTSADQTSFLVGRPGVFPIGTTGVPKATLTAAGDQFPAWLTLSDNGDGTGTLSGTPPPGSAGSHQFTLKAVNGFSPAASQDFTLFVDDSPVITSADRATFTAGQAGSFAVTTTAGFPSSTALSASGPLPSGLTFHDNGNGTATLAGTPDAGTGGSTTITISATAVGGQADPATQRFTLTVLEPPTISSADHVTFSEGSPASFTVRTIAGNPKPVALSSLGALPSGVDFTDNRDGTATIAGTPNAGTRGVYTITVTASNGVDPDATQTFTLTVNAAPQVTSTDHVTVVVNTAGTFTVTTSGRPTPSVTQSGSLPPGMTFTDNTDGTATLGGTPTAGGRFTFTITAANGVLPDATQSFTATVNAAPVITSADHTAFAVGSTGAFTVTTTPGVPDATTITESGRLPSGVSFHDNGDGTATLAGTPAAGSGGRYPLTLTAGNGGPLDAKQSFTLTVTDVPAITSGDHTTFTVGDAGRFTVTTRPGFPAAVNLTQSGGLPSGITFTDNGDGTATLAGTPAAGTGGSYPLTITVANSIGDSGQAFTLTVIRRPQTITVTTIPPATAEVGGSYVPTATSDSGLPVTVSIDAATTNSACSISGAAVHFDAAGSCVVDFEQSGDGSFAPAAQVQQTITVSKVGTTIAVTASPSSSVYGQSVDATVTVAADSGTPTGSVQLGVDGTKVGAPVAVTGGSPVRRTLTGPGGGPLAPGSHVVTASFTPTDSTTYASATASVTQVVLQAATRTSLSVHAHTLRAVVTAVAPGAGTPTGTVSFLVGGHRVGTARLTRGVANQTYTVPVGRANRVAASYSGDRNFTASSVSTSRHDPKITASLSSAHHRSRFGWYRSPVTIRFTCTVTSARLTSHCPAPVVLRHQGANQSVSRTIAAADGGTATVVVRGVNIDLTRPKVSIKGPRDGATYKGSAPRARCAGLDRLSGVASCRLTKKTHGDRISYRATATDRAGNTVHRSVASTVLAYYVIGARYRHGAFTVRAGHAYTLVAAGPRHRPVYYDAAVHPKRPGKRDNAFHRAGYRKWTLGVYLERGMHRHRYWNIGIKAGGTLHIIKIRVS
ncbi:putative Ig domain-containing protein [Microlunatus sp. Gsoil 973]|uniref:beta strand repeat-containing protein n=1 Tax=Microlunatus sp. Gsoil 973 TaxID=2672569 RepID=UPI0012B4D9B7|nr:putative Ig domain-containing protein [Microlunatus sp. Gsoil 973]QGN34369.1 hypothetical protein GJV80_17820 [Microlunatus sp. Gsoil 973]